jgi:hypothetical protein
MDPMNVNKERDVDQWLNAELGQYGKAEPRTGLENRVLANLRAERMRIAARGRWWWAVGTTTALAAIVVAAWIGEIGRERNPGITSGTSTTHREQPRGPIQARPAPKIAHPASGYTASQVAKRRPAKRPTSDLATASTPKLEQFPSPQPLSEQEQILMSYVVNYPEHAALVAQAQEEALLRDREEEAEAAKGNMR